MDSAWTDLLRREAPLELPWPEAGAPGVLITFEEAESWRVRELIGYAYRDIFAEAAERVR